MIDEFECSGMWWLPDRIENQAPGILKFGPAIGAELNLIKSFTNIENIFSLSNHEIILGNTTNGNVTLYRCFEIYQSIKHGITSSKYQAMVTIIGAHFSKAEDIKFKRIKVNYKFLYQWAGLSGIISEQRNDGGMFIGHQQIDPIKIMINEEYELIIEISVNYSRKIKIGKLVGIQENAHIIFESMVEKSFIEYNEIIEHFGNFLSFALNERVYPMAIEGNSELNKRIIKGVEIYHPINIFYKERDIEKRSDDVSPSRMYFSFANIFPKYEIIIKNWFSNYYKLSTVFNLYFEVAQNPLMSIEDRFLKYVFAIESYHRIKTKKGNSLQKRMTDVFNWHNEIIDIYGKYNIININKIVTSRDYYSHYIEQLEHKVLTWEELFYTTQILKVLIELCILDEIGFDLEERKVIISRNRLLKLRKT
jgi:hypothetical protein